MPLTLHPLPLRALLALCSLSFWSAQTLAARPMVVDDAGTLDRGGAKLEIGYSRDAGASGLQAAAGWAPLQHLELEIDLERQRDQDRAPPDRARSVSGVLKWVPLQEDVGLSAGVKLELGRELHDEAPRAYGRSVTALLSWRMDAGPHLHLNVGRQQIRSGGDTALATTWGVGSEWRLRDDLDLTVETFGARHESPGRQIGLRHELAKGLSLSGAVGRRQGRSLANVGLAWEF